MGAALPRAVNRTLVQEAPRAVAAFVATEKSLMRLNLVDILKRLSVYDPYLLVDSVEVSEADKSGQLARVAVVRLFMGPTVNVNLLLDIEASQAVVDGLCAKHRAHSGGDGGVSELMVLPGLDGARPILLGTHAALTGLDTPVIRFALMGLSHG